MVHLALVMSARLGAALRTSYRDEPQHSRLPAKAASQQVPATRMSDSCSRCQCPLGSACACGAGLPLPSRVRMKEKGPLWMGTGLSSAGWQAGFSPDQCPPLTPMPLCNAPHRSCPQNPVCVRVRGSLQDRVHQAGGECQALQGGCRSEAGGA